MSYSIVIADSSCLIALLNIGEIDILPKLYDNIFITPEVESEFGLELPDWIVVKPVIENQRLEYLKSILDLGEATSIALASDTSESLLVIDEKKGRRIATELGIAILGTVGVLIRAHESGLIDSLDSVAARLEAVGFRLSTDVKNELLGSIN